MGNMRNEHKMPVVNLKVPGLLEGTGVDGRIILKWIFGCKSVDWIQLVQDRAH
jgi:hypothetical protein